MNRWIRKFLRVLFYCCMGVSALAPLSATSSGANWFVLLGVYGTVAAAVLQIICDYLDRKETGWLRAELDATRSLASVTSAKLAPRFLSQAQREILRLNLSSYSTQRFQVFCPRSNSEGFIFAKIILEFLVTECGWINSANNYGPFVEEGILTMHFAGAGEGINIVASIQDLMTNDMGGQSTVPICEAFKSALNDAGIPQFSFAAQTMPGLQPGEIGIVMGVKPA